MRTRSPGTKPDPTMVTTEPRGPVSGATWTRGFFDAVAGVWTGRGCTDCLVVGEDEAAADWVEAAAGPGCAADLLLSPAATAPMIAAATVATAVIAAAMRGTRLLPPAGAPGG